MKKKAYITPNMIAVVLPKQPLLTPVSGIKDTLDDENGVSGGQGLSKGGSILWSDDDFAYEDYEEE